MLGGDVSLLRPLAMGVIPFVELFVRRGNSGKGAKSPAFLHRSSEDGCYDLCDRTSEVLQQPRFGVPRRSETNDHFRRVDLLSQLISEEERQKLGRMVWLAINGIWKPLR